MKHVGRTALAILFAGMLCSCDKPEAPEANTGLSPNASILPVPLVSAAPPIPESSAEATPLRNALRTREAGAHARPVLDAGEGRGADASDAAPRVPSYVRADEPLEPDPLLDAPEGSTTRGASGGVRELPGVYLEGEWHLSDVPAPFRSPEQNGGALELARKATALRWLVHMASAGRLSISFSSRAFTIAQGSELRARSDILGHLLVWPNGLEYRLLPPGAVRTLLAERRTDAIQLGSARQGGPTEVGRRFGLRTQRWELSTRTGKLVLDQARTPSAADGGLLLCRVLLELIAAHPLSSVCGPDDVPVRAQYSWAQGGSLTYEASELNERATFSPSALAAPPRGARFAVTGLPSNSGAFLSREELAAFRVRPLEPTPAGAKVPYGEVQAFNGTDLLRYLLLDGVPVAWVGPARTEEIAGLVRGRYQVQWRTFLGDAVDAAEVLELPNLLATGSHDGGASK